MLESVKIQRRQSEIRQALAALVGKEKPSEDETRSMSDLDKEYQTNETRLRGALIAEDQERRQAGAELETRSDREYADLIGKFELRQVALALDEGRALDGATAEIVQEMRSKGGYRGIPIPLQALEQRAGETVASGTPDPIRTMPIIDRLFPESVAARMGGQLVNIDAGQVEWPVVTSSVSAGWQATETGSVGAAAAFATTDKALAPEQTYGVQMKITRKALKQSGAALEQAVRRDMNSAISAGLDAAAFLGTGSSGQPLGVVVGASTYGITEQAVNAGASWSAFRTAVTAFLVANAVSSPSMVKALIRPEVWDDLDGTIFDSGSGLTEWDRLVSHIPASNIAMSSNALAAQAGSPLSSKVLLTTSAGGVAPFFIGVWGGIDLIRDPYSDAASGGLRLTGLVTADVTVARPAQLRVLTGVQ
ncbi:phage major capsid protein [Sinorhizobium fredii]|uniref:phage major capsid protein n=1 Tax=Rhizobium fredii TaxID=380 RepID=UPI0004B7D2E6|nr:phage major capsid protein [Sinorhizobium fredii]